ncbi:hypothetical protein B5F76_03970 [Desulfovibrio sp. An276]|nr:hypothetical protein B5F76_03970 [Desulfovibrio sp. An276]
MHIIDIFVFYLLFKPTYIYNFVSLSWLFAQTILLAQRHPFENQLFCRFSLCLELLRSAFPGSGKKVLGVAYFAARKLI